MLDPANSGPGKSFFMAGQQARYDMTDQAQMRQFMLQYNAALAAGPLASPGSTGPGGLPRTSADKRSAIQRKKKGKQERASRKAGRKRK